MNVAFARCVFALNRNALKGTMAAKLPDPNTMMVTISVRVDNDLVPVIGVNLKRMDSVAVGTVAQD